MSPKVATLVIVGALALAGIAWVLWAPTPQQTATPEEAVVPEAAELPADIPTTPASLYFLGEDGMLHGVEIEVPAEDGEGRVRVLVEALLAGPKGAEEGDLFLSAPMPPNVRLDGVYFLEESSVALDFRLLVTSPAPGEVPGEEGSEDSEASSREEAVPTAELPVAELASTIGRMGSKEEMLMVYSLVNTVAMGSGLVERVVLLLDGKQPETLAGHVDLTRPLRPDPTWIADG